MNETIINVITSIEQTDAGLMIGKVEIKVPADCLLTEYITYMVLPDKKEKEKKE